MNLRVVCESQNIPQNQAILRFLHQVASTAVLELGVVEPAKPSTFRRFLRKEAMSSWLELLSTVLAFAGFILIATYYRPAKNGDSLH
jgi:hypothetical protein